MSSQLIYPPEECPHPLSRIAPATSTAPAQCTSCGTVEPVDAKAVDLVEAEEGCDHCGGNGCPACSAAYAHLRRFDAKAVAPVQADAQVIEAQCRPLDAKAVNPGADGEDTTDAKAVHPWPGEGDDGTSVLHTAVLRTSPTGPIVLGNTWSEGFGRNTYAFRAETPPTPERRAELERQAAERKAKARRRGARAVARIARDRARGIRPCTIDRERSDDW